MKMLDDSSSGSTSQANKDLPSPMSYLGSAEGVHSPAELPVRVDSVLPSSVSTPTESSEFVPESATSDPDPHVPIALVAPKPRKTSRMV
ncbi:hypothetical protein HAX54_011648 [Datura stramonium]|uniref:Uncharacterized protein n=1 Tax=Datura stramonium TaxID=4076 RepID=A0ABS8TIG4_DATST|nr:hypothetical protein [Datura stramonium]